MQREREREREISEMGCIYLSISEFFLLVLNFLCGSKLYIDNWGWERVSLDQEFLDSIRSFWKTCCLHTLHGNFLQINEWKKAIAQSQDLPHTQSCMVTNEHFLQFLLFGRVWADLCYCLKLWRWAFWVVQHQQQLQWPNWIAMKIISFAILQLYH